MTIILEGPPSPFIDGWRHYRHLHDGAKESFGIGMPFESRKIAARNGAKFYPAGTWEAGEYLPSGERDHRTGREIMKWPAIKPEIIAEAKGGEA